MKRKDVDRLVGYLDLMLEEMRGLRGDVGVLRAFAEESGEMDRRLREVVRQLPDHDPQTGQTKPDPEETSLHVEREVPAGPGLWEVMSWVMWSQVGDKYFVTPSDYNAIHEAFSREPDWKVITDGQSRRIAGQNERILDLKARADRAEDDTQHWRTKAKAYGDMVHACSPAFAKAGFPIDSFLSDDRLGGIGKAAEALAAARDEAERGRDEWIAEAARIMCHACGRHSVGIALGEAEREVLAMRERICAERDAVLAREKWLREELGFVRDYINSRTPENSRDRERLCKWVEHIDAALLSTPAPEKGSDA